MFMLLLWKFSLFGIYEVYGVFLTTLKPNYEIEIDGIRETWVIGCF